MSEIMSTANQSTTFTGDESATVQRLTAAADGTRVHGGPHVAVLPASESHVTSATVVDDGATAEEQWVVAWPNAIWLLLLHVGVLLAPATFTWQALVLTFFLHWLTGGVGICLGFHRLLTHSSFRTYPAVRWFLAMLGSLAGEGSALEWVADHRKHHALSDQPGDPHSPRDGAWWSHMLWIVWKRKRVDREKHWHRWAPDLARDTAIRALVPWFLPLHFALAAILGGIGYLLGGSSMALSFVVWGVFVRLVFVMHSTWFVNSASHMWGYRNYETTDDSRNNWWVALITYGEGWHNNHHAYPRMAAHGHRWWELDATFAFVRLLRAVGLAWDVVDYKKRADGSAV